MEFSLQNLQSKNNSYGSKNQVSIAKNNGALAAMKAGKLTSSTSREVVNKKVETYAASVIDETSEIMKNSQTDLIFVIDRSGSTDGLESATCAGYNALITKEQQSGFKTKVTTVLFDDVIDTVAYRQDVNRVSSLYYRARGNTALYDALCKTMESVRASQIKDNAQISHTLVYIMTDGGDNCSHDYSLSSTRNLIKKYADEYGWEFLFLGALDNAQDVANELGIDYKNSVQIEKSQEGMYNSFVSTSQALEDLRTYGKLTDNWAKASKKGSIAIEDKNQKRLGLK